MSQELPKFVLPKTLITRVDLSRLVREIENVDTELESQKVRLKGQGGYHLPSMSSGMSEFLALNKLDISDDQQRATLKEQLRQLKDKVPVMHMTFASQADPESLEQLVAWIRQELHPWAILSIGLQPNLVGGAYVRTPNHVHDFSLRALFKNKTDLLLKALEEPPSA